jgi:hypothetical protein
MVNLMMGSLIVPLLVIVQNKKNTDQVLSAALMLIRGG